MLQRIDPILFAGGRFFLFGQEPLQIARVGLGDIFEALTVIFTEADSGEEERPR